MPGLRYRLPSGWSFAVNGGFFTSDDDWAIDATYSTSENGRLQYYDSQTRTIAVECIKSFRWQERFGLGPALRLGHSYSRQTLAEETLSANENPFAWVKRERWARDRSEDSNDSVYEVAQVSTRSSDGWSLSLVNPSVSMGLTLIFYF